MKREYTPEEILYKAAAYCSVAERCESEVRTKLAAWGMSEEALQDKIIDYLYDENYISEERYCRAFVHDKLLYQGWGRQKIRAMLQAKRLPAHAIKEALEQINEEEYMRILRDVLTKKAKTIRGETEEEKHIKLLRFAASRGFSYSEVAPLLSPHSQTPQKAGAF